MASNSYKVGAEIMATLPREPDAPARAQAYVDAYGRMIVVVDAGTLVVYGVNVHGARNGEPS